MLGGENVSLVFCRELLALVECHLQRSVVRLQQHVGHNDFVLQFGMLAFVSWILMAPDVPPRPAVETAWLHMRDVVGHQIVAEGIAFIHRTP
jgi:hypothetical protein